jgi:hypothetical protein
MEIAAGRTSATSGLVLSVQKEGGIAGPCTVVAVYSTGVAYASECSGDVPATYPAVRLDAEQLEMLYGWLDTVISFEAERTDGTADTMTTRTTFSGRGFDEVTPEQQEQMEAMAADLLAQAQASGEAIPAQPAAEAASADLSGCPTGSDDRPLYADGRHGYCLLAPAEWQPVEYATTSTAFTRGGDIMNHFDARLDISVEEARGATAQMAADARVSLLHQDMPDWEVDTEEISLGGEPALELRALPGQDLQRVIYVAHGGNLYSFVLTPDDASVDRHADMQALYDALLETFTFTD